MATTRSGGFTEMRVEPSGGLAFTRCYRLVAPVVTLDYYPYPVPTATTPAAGGRIDGVFHAAYHGQMAVPGRTTRVQAAVPFSSGAPLRTDSDGRVREASAGDYVVLRALGGAGTNDITWAVFESAYKI